MSKIKEQLIGYEHKSEWLDATEYVLVSELVEYQLYCMTVSEMQAMAADRLRQEYHAMPYSDFKQKYDNAFGGNRDE